MYADGERRFVTAARVARLATADGDGRPHVVPICFALDDDDVVTPIDEKPQRVGPTDLRRSRDVAENPRVALVVDRYAEDWAKLGWVQVRGIATHCRPDDDRHDRGVTVLREKYDQYDGHELETRPLIRIDVGGVRSWGRLEPLDGAR